MVSAVRLEQEDHKRDADFSQAMHGGKATESGYFAGFLAKDKQASAEAAAEYFKHWDGFEDGNETEEEKQKRLAEYATLTRHYYNLATDLYENGWGQSFHFCRFYPREAFNQAIARHEHFLALKMGIKPGMHVLDVGCGVGGPAREIARFSDCKITGLNNNDYQIARAGMYAQKAGLGNQLVCVHNNWFIPSLTCSVPVKKKKKSAELTSFPLPTAVRQRRLHANVFQRKHL